MEEAEKTWTWQTIYLETRKKTIKLTIKNKWWYLLPILLLMTGDLECFSPISTKMHCNPVFSLSHLKIFYPFLLHQILTLTLIYSCQALITQPSLNSHATITQNSPTQRSGILLDQPWSNPRIHTIFDPCPSLTQVDVYPSTTRHPTSFNHQPTLTQPFPSPHWSHTIPSLTLTEPLPNPHQHPTLAQPSPNPRPTLFLPSPTPLHTLSHPTFTRLSLVYSRPSPASKNRYLSIK